MVLRAFAGTDTGCVREHNEDALLLEPEHGLFGVFDGVGGHLAGEVASALAARTVSSEVAAGTGLRDAILEAHRQIRLQAASNPGQHDMASTGVVLRRRRWRGFELAWVGDSRCYRVDLEKASARQLTVDHSFVQEKISQGVLRPEEVATHPMANMLTRVLGQPRGWPRVDVLPVKLPRRSLLLLCSDGLTAVLGDAEIATLCAHHEGQGRIDALITAARERGAPDNVSVITVERVAGACPIRWLKP